MPDSSEFLRKSVLLDTNILKEMLQKTKRSASFRPVFDFLKKMEMVPFIIEATKFEFLGYSTNKKEFESLKAYIENPIFWTHHIQTEDIELATKLSAMYKCKNSNISPKQISFVDCLHAAQILKYKGNAIVITTDINDYPSFLFDVSKYFPIEESGGNTTFVALKTFSKDKWDLLQKDFESSGSE